jgi:mannose-1-phosphate guanylyltransferase
MGRNTAPAIALAAHAALAADEADSLLLVLPADHVIRDTEEISCRDQDRQRRRAR